jgi:hypothetical protein
MSVINRWNRIAAYAREKWERRRRMILSVSVVLMGALAAWRLPRAFNEFLQGVALGDTPRIFHSLIRDWLASRPVYGESEFAVHPPATYVMLWPFFGWLETTPAHWLWLAVTIAALVWLVYLMVRESGAQGALERAFIALIPLCSYATTRTVRNGQFTVLLLPLLLAGLRLLRERKPDLSRDFLAAALLLPALVKPTVAAPFFWIALFLPGGLRPTILVALGYAALTFFAASYQEADLPTLVRDWWTSASTLATQGSANVHIGLTAIGLADWTLPASLLIFAGLGWWIYRHRRADLLLLVGVTAIVARFWTYHRAYDDALLLLPAIALFHRAKEDPSDRSGVAAATLFALLVGGMFIPFRLLGRPIWRVLLIDGNAIVWLAALIFLIAAARRFFKKQTSATKRARAT